MANGIAARIEMVEPLESRTAQLRAMADIRLVPPRDQVRRETQPERGETQNHFQCREVEGAGQLTERAMRVIVL